MTELKPVQNPSTEPVTETGWLASSKPPTINGTGQPNPPQFYWPFHAKIQARERILPPRKPFHNKLFKTPKETMLAVFAGAVAKTKMKWHKIAFLGWLAGIFVSYGALWAFTVAGGVPNIRANAIGLQKLLFGLCFPSGLVFIVIYGGELFTGNIMYMTLAYLGKGITFKALLKNLVIVYITNFIGCVMGAYFFGYLTELYTAPYYIDYAQSFAINKLKLDFGTAFIRAIPANMIVCLAIFLSVASEDVASKIIGCWVPIAAFGTIGFEHCVANMFLVTFSILQGADESYWKFLYANLIPVTLGNIIGGGLIVGGGAYYIYAFNEDVVDEQLQAHTEIINKKLKKNTTEIVLNGATIKNRTSESLESNA